MGLKLFGAGGIDQKTNNLLRDPRKLRDARNIEYNTHGEYVKRDGSDIDATSTEIYDTLPYSTLKSNVIYIKSLDTYFAYDGVNYIVLKNGIKETLPGMGFTELGVIGTDFNEISSDEYLNTLVFTHKTNQVATCIYDGQSVYRAGLPAPVISSVTAGSLFMLSFFEFVDHQGNTTMGPATITPSADSSGTISFDNLETGFYNIDLLVVTFPVGITFIDKTTRTLSNVITNNYEVGQKICIRSSSRSYEAASNGLCLTTISQQDSTTINGDLFILLEIESKTANSVTFTEESFKNRRITFTVSATSGNYQVATNTILRLFFSSSETTGYTGYTSDYGIRVVNSLATNTRVYTTVAPLSEILLSDIYDITTSKLRPPKCSTIKVFGEQLVCGGVLSFWDFNNKETNYTNNDLVMYSDSSTGDIGFNFSEINRQLIGNTYDGQIIGMTRAKDSMIIFKDTSVYSIDGVLIPGQYGLRKIETNEIGCLSESSIISTDGVVVFQGQDGLYQLNGYKAVKITDELDLFFDTIDPTKTRSVVRNKKDQFLFFTDLGVVVYDYHHKEWFIWDTLSAEYGVIVDNNRDIKMFLETEAIEFVTAKNDQGAAIDSYIETAWFDLGEPSLLKKLTDIRVFALNNPGYTLTLQVFRDWDINKFKAPFTIDFTDTSTKTDLRKIDIQMAQSISLKMSNAVIDEDINISGYELLIDVIQSKDKNVK